MHFGQLYEQLNSLAALLSKLRDDQYTHNVHHLGNASIGAHTRHILELLDCLVTAYSSGIVDYQHRSRNLRLEQDRQLALHLLSLLLPCLEQPDKAMKFAGEPIVHTTYFREVAYHTEHSIHHLALIKVALLEMALPLVHENFGMGYSTIQYKQGVEQVKK